MVIDVGAALSGMVALQNCFVRQFCFVGVFIDKDTSSSAIV
jgi:hypothetical protein